MATAVPVGEATVNDRVRRLLHIPRWSTPAWGAIGVASLFLGITFWWLSQDHSIPIYDAGLHLSLAFHVHKELAEGHFTSALTLTHPYPPLSYLIGSLGILIGGLNVSSPIIAENLVFVPLLALGCYHVGRLAFGRPAGLLAVIFALGSPLYIAQFHVFMTDAPETAMVAVSVWAILATDGFLRLGVSALAGLAVGFGMLSKEPFIFFVVGPLAVTAIRGGYRAWRGLFLFALVTFVIASPWYLHELTSVKALTTGATHSVNAPGKTSISPARFSRENLTWYLWVLIDSQVYLPLFFFSAVGWVWTLVGFVRRRSVSRLAPELAIGAFVSWFAITETFAHDTRYSMPLLIYLAVFGAGWITRLPSRARIASAALLVIIAIANTLGITFGAGELVQTNAASALGDPGESTIFSNAGFLAGAPRSSGNILPTLRALKRDGVTQFVFEQNSLFEVDFSAAGLQVLSTVAGVEGNVWNGEPLATLNTRYATFTHHAVEEGDPPPCVTLNDGTGVWIGVGGPEGKPSQEFCPG